MLARRRFGLAGLRDRLAGQREPEAQPPAQHLQPTDFFEAIQLLPHLSEVSANAILGRPVAAAEPRKLDVICFSIIDWSFRFQRPQQLMAQFAAHGHRVFYLNISDFLSQRARPRFAVAPIDHPAPGEILEVKIATRTPLDLAGGTLDEREVEHVLASLDELRRAYNINDAIGYVMIPSWSDVACKVRERWGWRIVYDCMDEWENFPGLKPEAIVREKDLVQSCDLLVITAQRLYDKWRPYGRPMVLARNAADYEFYAARCRPNDLLPGIKHPVVGYFGAIADWFDVELLAETARQRPGYTFVLLGGAFDVDVSALQRLSNVKLLGQQPYETMPQYLYHFDVCIIPFRINPITEATDPVKLYEYLSGGKPVVSIRLPELEIYRDDVYLAENQAEFVAQLDAALAEDDPAKAARRRGTAQEQSWRSRYRQITTALTAAIPRASIIVVTYNNLALTKLCLESLLRNTEHPNYAVVIVDNHSTDGTPAYLQEMAARHGNLRLIFNDENHGFARANNQGLTIATGQHLVLLNNDTIVPPGWLSRLLWHLGDPAVGLVGPVTNSIGNEARIEAGYQTWVEMEAFARKHTWSKQAQIADIPMLAMYCVAMRHEVFDRIGPLDEQFGIGMFEDDDYAMRVRRAGLRIVCAADVFVHHFGQAAFGKLIESGAYHDLFDQNRYKFEAKWQEPWQPHRRAELSFAPHTVNILEAVGGTRAS